MLSGKSMQQASIVGIDAIRRGATLGRFQLFWSTVTQFHKTQYICDILENEQIIQVSR